MSNYPVGTALNVYFDNLPEIVPHIKGTLKELWGAKEFQSRNGTSTRQNGVLSTENGDIAFTIFGKEEIPTSMKGKQVEFRCSKGKGGLGGVEYSLNEYNGKTTEQLTLSYRAEIDFGKSSNGSSEPKARVAPKSNNQNDSRAFMDVVSDLVERQGKINTFVRSFYGDEHPEETLASYVMNICITAERIGAYNLPIESKPEKPAEPEYDPERWAEVIIPAGPNKGKTLASVGKQKIYEFDRYREKHNKTGGFWDCVQNAASILSFEEGTADEGDEIPI